MNERANEWTHAWINEWIYEFMNEYAIECIWKWHYRHISAVNYLILIQFGKQMQISIPKMDFWQETEILQIQDGRRPLFWKQYYLNISAVNYPI